MQWQSSPPDICGNEGQRSVFEAARAYLRYGWNIVPLDGKRPTVKWRTLQYIPVSEMQLRGWYIAGQLQNVGIVCGAVSRHLVVLDIDQEVGYAAFSAAFPSLVETYTVQTGSGRGYHLYWVVKHLPITMRIHNSALGNLELLAEGCQVVAPPSAHPHTGNRYTVNDMRPLLVRSIVTDVQDWLFHLRETNVKANSHDLQPATYSMQMDYTERHARLVEYFERQHYHKRGNWLNGTCVFPHYHRQNDIHPSFGFNLQSGYGHCFLCGTLSPEMLCRALNISF